MRKQTFFLVLVIAISRTIYAQNDNFIFVKGASYKMGDLSGKGKENERPVHDVTINSFFVSKFQVTVGDFKAFITETGYVTDCEKKKGGMI
jgi:formylglycine-generating enzyme required for sulfatase activity